ncbi:MAG: cation:proton antiporter, partial [Candidatus Omnitrophica bacterium]|nr:cation:proton antiporter [Candidatus Omnitrophota bacterium]
MNTIFSLGIILLVGLFAAKILRQIKFPAVTTYLLLGIIIGPHLLNFVSPGIINSSGLISNIVLSIIAFGLGQNFSKEHFKKIGKSVLTISILEAVGAWILVTLALFFILKQQLYLALLFGSIGAATAPAATVMVIREYRARGTFTNTLLGVVALDDAWCLIIFSVSLAIARALSLHLGANILLLKIFLHTFGHIIGAFLLGGIIGILLNWLGRFVKTRADLLIITLGSILVTAGLSILLDFSVLLANMALGTVLINLKKHNYGFFEILHTVDTPLFLFFFVLAGANLEIPLLPKIGVIAITYFVFVVVGKIAGA